MTRAQIGYCTNVHAGQDLEQAQRNLERHALGVKARVSADAPMGVGLWLPASTAEELRDESVRAPFRDWLREVGLRPFTLNGFPFGDFHRDVVGHQVYLPTWWERPRFDYTLNLIDVLDDLLEPGVEGSISTLPLAWGSPPPRRDQLEAAAAHLRRLAERLAAIEQERGRLIHLCIEPEPGCILQRSDDVVSFFQDHLFGEGDEERVRRHVRVCHDVCHAVVMFEEQEDVLRRYASAGILVGKVQVSSAVCLPFDALAEEQRRTALEQLAQFEEPRYLHQTVVCESSANGPVFYENLPLALVWANRQSKLQGEWRVHFHVPIFLERFGLLATSRPAILQCLDACRRHSDVSHFEVETYAWGVLPAELQVAELAVGIARETSWLREALAANG